MTQDYAHRALVLSSATATLNGWSIPVTNVIVLMVLGTMSAALYISLFDLSSVTGIVFGIIGGSLSSGIINGVFAAIYAVITRRFWLAQYMAISSTLFTFALIAS